MKKYFFIVAVVIALPVVSSACDICGCGVGNNYIGILPDFNKKILGLRYRYNAVKTHIGIGGASTHLTTNETYKTMEFWGGYNIGTNFRVMLSVPYNFNQRSNQNATRSKNGLGDVSTFGYYQLVNKKKMISEKMLIQSLWVGGGIKLPTGDYNASDKAAVNENINLFQLGTGSTDFMMNVMYDLRFQDAGLNLTSSYKLNTTNRYDYKYGDKLSINSQVYYKFRIKKKLTVAPNTGIQYEKSKKDSDKNFEVDISGGNLLLGTAGIEATLKKISIGGNYQTPFSQNLGRGFVRAKSRFMIHVSLVL